MTMNASAPVLTGAARARYSLIPGQDARVVIAEVMAQGRPVVWVAADDVRLQTLSALVAFLRRMCRLLNFRRGIVCRMTAPLRRMM